MLVTGQTQVAQQSTQGWKKTTGYWKRLSEQFTTEAAAVARGWALSNQGYEWTVSPLGGGCYSLEATAESSAPSNSGVVEDPNIPLSETWELQPNMVEKDILDGDKWPFTQAETAKIRAYINSKVNDGSASSFTSADGTNYANMNTACALLNAGVKSFRVFQPTLRHTKLVRRDYQLKQALTNVGKILTTTKLNQQEGVPGTILFNLPNDSDPTRYDGVALSYGWFKKYPTVTQVSAGRWQMTQEWEYGLWATALYTFV